MDIIYRKGLKMILTEHSKFLKKFLRVNKCKTLDGFQIHNFEQILNENKEIIRILG